MEKELLFGGDQQGGCYYSGGDTSDLQMSAQLVLGYCDYGLFRVRCGDVSPHLNLFWLL